MENAVMRGEEIDSRYRARTVISMGGAVRVVDSYLNSPVAIGYTFMYYSSSMVTSDKIKYLSIDGVAPTPESVQNVAYAFRCPFYAVTLESNDDENTAALLEWITSSEGQGLVAKTGYVPL
jgi:phosphate transport system substrate-binding protein